MTDDPSKYEKYYSEDGFWSKVGTFSKKVGKKGIEKSLYLFYAAKRPETPIWARVVIYSALGYFIFPIDAMPDPIFVDDIAVMGGAVVTVAAHINKDVKTQAKQKLSDWFD